MSHSLFRLLMVPQPFTGGEEGRVPFLCPFSGTALSSSLWDLGPEAQLF